MERKNTETGNNKQTIKKKGIQRKRKMGRQRKDAKVANTHSTKIIRTAGKIKAICEIHKQAGNYLSVLEELANINSMNSMKTKTKEERNCYKHQQLERKTELQEKIGNEGRKEGRKAWKHKRGLVWSV